MTAADERAAAKVRALWADFQKKNPGISQEAAAHRIGYTQSAFSQFLLGRVPMRVTPVLQLARLFDVDPGEIRDDIPALAYSAARVPTALSVREPTVAAPRRRDVRSAKAARGDAEKLLVLLRTFLDTDSEGREQLYGQALAVKHADESTTTIRTERRARGKAR